MAWVDPTTRATGDLITASIWNGDLVNNLKAVAAVGSLQYVIAASGGAAVATTWQSGWLECNGALVSRTTYANLFAYLNGLTPALPFGTGDGSTTFALPNLRGRAAIAVGGHTDVATLGNNDGVVDANRRPKHRTTSSLAVSGIAVYGAGGAGPSGNGINISVGSANTYGDTTTIETQPSLTGSVGTNNANDALDAPAYEVAGIWVCKF